MADANHLDGAARSSHEQAAELLDAYALDALTPEEVDLVERHLEEGCEGCEGALGALRRVVASLPLALPLHETSASLKERTLQAVATAPLPRRAAQPSPARGRLLALPPLRWRRATALAASVATLGLTGLLAWNILLQVQVDDLETESVSLQGAVSEVESGQIEARSALNVAEARTAETQQLLQTVDERMTAALVSLSGPSTQTLELQSTSLAPAASGRMLWDPAGGVIIIVASGLDPTHAGAAYMVWVDMGKGLTKIGHFYVDESGNGAVHGVLDLPLSEAKVVMVSHEEDLSAAAPSTQPLLLFAP